MNYADHKTSLPPAPAVKVIPVPPSAFNAAWKARPTEPVRIGIRCPSCQDLVTARAEAERKARELHKDHELRASAYNDILVGWLVARGTCRPEDASKPYFHMAEDTVLEALTPEGLRSIFEVIETVYMERSPLLPEVSEDGLELLADFLDEPEFWARVSPAKAVRLRRLLGYVLDSLTSLE